MSATAPAAQSSGPPRRYANTDPVVDARRIKNRFCPNPLFGSDRWDLSCLAMRPNARAFRLDFGRLEPRWRLPAKEIIAQRLNEPVPSIRPTKHCGTVGPESCIKFLQHMTSVFAFLDERKIASIPAIRAEDIDVFRTGANGKSTDLQSNLLKIFDIFYESRAYLSGGGLGFEPHPGKSLRQMVGCEPIGECKTERLPESVMRAMLFWAQAYIERFAPDILAAEKLRHRGPTQKMLAEADRRAALQKDARRKAGLKHRPSLREEMRLRLFVARMNHLGSGMPARERGGVVKMAADIVAIGADVPIAYVHSGPGAAYLRDCGLRLETTCLGAAAAKLDGAVEPWRPPFTIDDLDDECLRLQVAAYVIVAYMSGMRDSEIQTLREGCLTTMRDERGEIYRYKLNGLAWKGARGKPKKRSWVVIAPVAKAIEVLEALRACSRPGKGDLLFERVRHADNTNGLPKGRINDAMREFATYCDEEVALRQAGSSPPETPRFDGEVWPFKPTQFRRTLAWHIANQPFGVVAGMIQYGHAAIQMFEGYAGDSDSGFAAEVARERFLARLGDITTMFEDEQRGSRQAGPMAAELSAWFEKVRSEIEDFPGEVVDGKRARKLLENRAGDLYVGQLVHCFYTPEVAKCQSHLKMEERVEPLTGLCDPDCNNACWTKKDLPGWLSTRDELKELLKPGSNSMPRRQRDILERQSATAKRVIEAITAATEGANR